VEFIDLFDFWIFCPVECFFGDLILHAEIRFAGVLACGCDVAAASLNVLLLLQTPNTQNAVNIR